MSDYWSREIHDFRLEVREFLGRQLPAGLSRKVLAHEPLQKDDYVQWQKILRAKGWLAYPWPVDYGGTGWTPMQMHVFEEEAWLAGAPELLAFGFKMLAPVLMNYGDQRQKQHYLPRILDSEDWWCQGYSEPGAGSDLASLRTTARLEGDHYIVNGQKTW
ncbi:MAG: acyl-CoA dehydrogenase family protein, partial [Burkholderiaceae bacterium]